MTTTVKRGAGRPAAAARTNKHAQRNPQPRSHTTDVIADEVLLGVGPVAAESGTPKEQSYGRMTVPELRARLEALGGWKRGMGRLSKGQLLNLILQAERTPTESQAEILHTAVVAATESSTQTQEGGDPKGNAKADKLQNALYPHGWSFSARNHDGDRVEAVLVRGGEALTVVWDAGVFNYAETGHLVGDRYTKVRNVSAAIKLGTRPAEAAEQELSRVVANKRFKPSTPRGLPASRRIPFDAEKVTEPELLQALAGKTVEWVNRVSHNTETAIVSKNPKFFRVEDRSDGRVLQFASESGFRACRLDQIVRVGGSTRKRPVAA